MLHRNKTLDGCEKKYIVQCSKDMNTDVPKDRIVTKAVKKPYRVAKATPAVENVIVAEKKPILVQEAAVIEPEVTPILAEAAQEEKPMTKTTTNDFVNLLTNAFGNVQEKAQAAVAKGTAAFGEYNAFAKGNVEALIESGKILAAGVQEMGTAIVAESRSAFETVSGDVKGLAAVKTPTDFVQMQGELIRKQFDSAVTLGSKQTEAAMKLASDVVAPLSTRVNLAVEKVKTAA